MPLVKSGSMPDWSELKTFETIRLPAGETICIPFAGPKERLIPLSDGLFISDEAVVRHTVLDISPCPAYHLSAESGGAFMRLVGCWGDVTGFSGVFELGIATVPANPGDPVEGSRNTVFDNHYHDSDEFWILFEGRGIAVSEGTAYEVGPGDCVATRAGDHHDFPMVYEPIKAVYQETTLRGQQRLGHLWQHRHG